MYIYNINSTYKKYFISNFFYFHFPYGVNREYKKKYNARLVKKWIAETWSVS